jgi:hypothetical protein
MDDATRGQAAEPHERAASKWIFGGLVLMLILGVAAFSRPSDRFYNGFDGTGVRIFVRQMFGWTTFHLGLSHDPFEGMGGLFFLNIHMIPSFDILGMLGTPVGVVLAYALAAAELYLATILLGRALRFSNGTCIVAGFLFPLLSLPFFEVVQLYPFLNVGTNIADAIAGHIAAIALFAFALSGPPMKRSLATLGLAALATWSVCAQPTFIVAFAPAALGAAAGFLLLLPGWRMRLMRPLLPLLPILALLAGGGGLFLYGLFTDTAASVFQSELNQIVPRVGYQTSIAFQGWIFGWSGPLLMVAAAGGFALRLRRADGRRYGVAAACMVGPQLVIDAAFLSTSGTWVYPVPIYFELALWPLYALYAADLLACMVSLVRSKAGPIAWRPGLAVGLTLLAAVALHFQPLRERHDIYTPDPADNDLTRIMTKEIALVQPGPFRGYVAAFMGFGGKGGPPADWFSLLQDTYKVATAIGNPLRLIGLWQFDLPTLEDYQPTTAPAFYAVVTRLLARPVDKQWRDVLVLTNPRPDVLASLGVRYVIADVELEGSAVERAHLTIAGVPPIRLYELSNPNLGTYSPTDVVQVTDAATALSAMADPEFDFRHRVLVFEPINQTLSPAASVVMKVERGFYSIAARSAGESLLVLPLQYSHCMSIEIVRGEQPRLIRANLAQAGLVFTGDMEIRLSQHTGPFDHPGCLWHDTQDARRLGIGQLSRNPAD